MFSVDKFDEHNEKPIKTNINITKVLQSETLEVSSTSEEEISEEEESEENEEDDESEKEDGQESKESSDECIEEEEEEIQGIHQIIDDKKDDLRTEIKRRRALRLNNMV